MNHWLHIGLLAFALACGGSSDGDSSEETSGGEHTHGHDHGDEHHSHAHDDDHHDGHDHDGHGEHGHHDHGEMPPALHAFHEAFAGHWHGDRSAAAVCPEVENLKSLSDAAGAESTDTEQVTELTASSEAAVAACASGEGWDAAFDRWHNALHGIMGQPHHE